MGEWWVLGGGGEVGVGGEVGRFAFCVLWPGAGVGAAGGAAPNLIPKPGRRQVSAERDEVPAACGGPSTPGGGRQVKNPTTLVGQRLRLPHCVEVGVGGVWGTARPVRVVRVVANVAEVGGEGGVAVGSRGGLKGTPFTWGTWAVVVVSTSVISISSLFVAVVAVWIA